MIFTFWVSSWSIPAVLETEAAPLWAEPPLALALELPPVAAPPDALCDGETVAFPPVAELVPPPMPASPPPPLVARASALALLPELLPPLAELPPADEEEEPLFEAEPPVDEPLPTSPVVLVPS